MIFFFLTNKIYKEKLPSIFLKKNQSRDDHFEMNTIFFGIRIYEDISYGRNNTQGVFLRQECDIFFYDCMRIIISLILSPNLFIMFRHLTLFYGFCVCKNKIMDIYNLTFNLT